MFEYSADNRTAQPDDPKVIQDAGVPVEFAYKGRVFRIYALLTRWKETIPWWKHIESTSVTADLEEKIVWSVEAAPIGTVHTFEIEFNQTTNTWKVRPTSRSK